jgi:membrane protein
MRERLRIAKRGFDNFRRDGMTTVAAALAYYAFLALPSALMIAVGTFGLLAGPNAVSTVIDRLHGVMPEQASALLDDSLRRLIDRQGTSIAVLATGLLLALWSLTGAMQNVMWGVNLAFEREERRGFIRRRLVAGEMVLFALLGFVLAFGVLTLGPHLSRWVGDAVGARRLVETAWYVTEWPLVVVGLLISFAGVMYLAPSVEHRNWRLATFGSLLATALWLAGSAAFSVYVSGFGSYNKAWGSLAAVVVMLTWLWLGGVALLLGAEIDAAAGGRDDRARRARSPELSPERDWRGPQAPQTRPAAGHSSRRSRVHG